MIKVHRLEGADCIYEKALTLSFEDNGRPRETAWFGPVPYSYSGITHGAQTYAPEWLSELQDAYACNSCLVNLYRDGKDSVGWHCDDEDILDPLSPIYSVSLGATRRFSIRVKGQRSAAMNLDLRHGDVVCMPAGFQDEYEHCVRKTKKTVGPRINLTLRRVVG